MKYHYLNPKLMRTLNTKQQISEKMKWNKLMRNDKNTQKSNIYLHILHIPGIHHHHFHFHSISIPLYFHIYINININNNISIYLINIIEIPSSSSSTFSLLSFLFLFLLLQILIHLILQIFHDFFTFLCIYFTISYALSC